MVIPSEELSDQHHCSPYGTTQFTTLKLNTPAIWGPSYPVDLASTTMLASGWDLEPWTWRSLAGDLSFENI